MHGIHASLVTPFTRSGAVDGLVSLGTTCSPRTRGWTVSTVKVHLPDAATRRGRRRRRVRVPRAVLKACLAEVGLIDDPAVRAPPRAPRPESVAAAVKAFQAL